MVQHQLHVCRFHDVRNHVHIHDHIHDHNHGHIRKMVQHQLHVCRFHDVRNHVHIHDHILHVHTHDHIRDHNHVRIHVHNYVHGAHGRMLKHILPKLRVPTKYSYLVCRVVVNLL